MDVHELTVFLAPALSFLLGVGQSAVHQATEKLGAEVWEQARRLWERLRPAVAAKPAADEAAHDLASSPDDPDARGAFALQLRKLFEADPDLRHEVGELWTSATVIVGQRGVGVQGDVTNSVIVTGDNADVDAA